jgi:hypothetical protein
LANVAAVKRRDRLVYFRISEEEFEQIVKACDSKGARSVSDLARSAVQEFIKPVKPESEYLFETLNSLSAGLEEINRSVRQLLLNTLRGMEVENAAAAAATTQDPPAQLIVDESTETSKSS